MDPPNGRVLIDSEMDGLRATYVCDEGFYLIGDDSRTCDFSVEVWSGLEPVCQRTLFFFFHFSSLLTL